MREMSLGRMLVIMEAINKANQGDGVLVFCEPGKAR